MVADEPDPPRRDGRLERGPRAVGHHPTTVDHRHPVGELISLLQVVGGEDDRAPLLAELPDHAPEGALAFDVHSRGRLVEEDQLGIPGNRDGEAHPLGLATRELVRRAAKERANSGPFHSEVKGGRKAAGGAGLEHGPDPTLGDRAPGRGPQHLDGARGGAQQPQ